MNAISNEALPIFLEALVPPSVAILCSVTLVLFFGEIFPSAIFTGPQQLVIAHRLLPLVRLAMWLLYPLAGPIAALLDWFLHDDEDVAAYNRGELSALIRIHYEERMASKQKRRQQELAILQATNGDHVGALDFTSVVFSAMEQQKQQSLRATKRQVEHDSQRAVAQSTRSSSSAPYDKREFERSNSIHFDEVTMAEGALQMRTKVAVDVFTPLRKIFSVPMDMELTEKNMVKIYASGFTRVPVYVDGQKSAIAGLLMTRQLIVVDPRDARPVSTLPLRVPLCVSPTMPLVHVLNLLQTGGDAVKGGHMALVCARPHVGNKALSQGEGLPETAALMGIITLEDVLEALLQEQIYDEMDKKEREATRLAQMVCRKWKGYVARKKKLRQDAATENTPLLV